MELTSPHGGRLCELLLHGSEAESVREAARKAPSWSLTPRQLCDLELLLNGGFSPLRGFIGEDDYNNVVSNMRLANGLLWPMPVTLDVSEEFAAQVETGEQVGLRDEEGVLLAVLEVSSIWRPDRKAAALAVFGSDDTAHPAVRHLLEHSEPVCLGGRVRGLELPRHYDFPAMRDTPAELRAEFAKRGWHRVVAFQTRNPMHRAHFELTRRAAHEVEANLLIHPVVGMTRPGDIDHYTRVRCYEKLLPHYPEQSTRLSLLPLAMRMGGPREALWHAIIRKNYGCTHFIVGRDHAGPGKNSKGEDFYDPYAAQELVAEHTDELGVTMVPFRNMVYVRELAAYAPEDEVAPDSEVLSISGTELRKRLAEDREIPEWFSFPEVVGELRRTHPPLAQRGLTIFFTGLSGAGKSTLANALRIKLLERGGRQVTLLDGDIVRKHLSSELGFSREHRDLNIRRIGFVASEITRHGGIAICAPIAPYAETRREVREIVAAHGGFIEVHVATPLNVCEARDRKGLYALAREGKIDEFTGISDPYEAPDQPELRIDTSDLEPDVAVQEIMLKLEALGYLE